MPRFNIPTDAVKELVEADADELWTNFGPWRTLVTQVYDPAVDQPIRKDVMALMNPNIQRPQEDQEKSILSEFYSAFIPINSKTLVNRMSRGDMNVRVGTENGVLDEKDKEQQRDVEWFFRGLVNLADSKLQKSGEGTSFRRKCWAHINNPGKGVCHIHVTDDGEGNAVFNWQLWNPRNFVHDFTQEDPWRGFYQFPQTVPAVKKLIADWQADITSENEIESVVVPMQDLQKLRDRPKDDDVHAVGVYYSEEDYYPLEGEDPDPDLAGSKTVHMGILVDGELAFLKRTALKRRPIVMAAVNSNANTYEWFNGVGALAGDGKTTVPDNRMLKHAEPWFASIITTVRQYERINSLVLNAAHLAANPPLAVQSPEGKFIVKSWQIAPGRVLNNIPLDVAMKLMDFSISGMEVVQFQVQELKDQMNMAFPAVLRGQTDEAGISGFGFDRRLDEGKTAIVDPVDAGQSFMQGILVESLVQFQDATDEEGKPLKVTLRGMSSTGEGNHTVFQREFKSSTIPSTVVPIVELPPSFPENILETINAANGVADRFMTKRSILSNLFRKDDPDAELRALELERNAETPQGRAFSLLDQLNQEIAEAEAEAQRQEDRTLKRQARVKARFLRSQLTNLTQQLLNGQPPLDQAQPPGIRPSEAPPESLDTFDLENSLSGANPPTGGVPNVPRRSPNRSRVNG